MNKIFLSLITGLFVFYSLQASQQDQHAQELASKKRKLTLLDLPKVNTNLPSPPVYAPKAPIAKSPESASEEKLACQFSPEPKISPLPIKRAKSEPNYPTYLEPHEVKALFEEQILQQNLSQLTVATISYSKMD